MSEDNDLKLEEAFASEEAELIIRELCGRFQSADLIDLGLRSDKADDYSARDVLREFLNEVRKSKSINVDALGKQID